MMPELLINGKDAYTTWGVTMDESALSALMTPPGLKDEPSEDYALEDGTVYGDGAPKVAERELNLTINLTARSEAQFMARYAQFCTELQRREITIRTAYQPEVLYRCRYRDCRQFSQFMRGIAKFNLRLVEPDPTNRRLS